MPAQSRTFRWIFILLALVAVAIVVLFVDFHTYKQGEWSDEIKDKFYFTDQGSKLLPVDWFLSLTEPGTETRVSANLERFAFIPAKRPGKYNLPIGFAVHAEPDTPAQEWIGLTCAACHTGRLVFEDKREFIVEGGQALVDFDSFFADVVGSLSATVADAGQFGQFAARVKESAQKYGRTPQTETDLRRDVEARTKLYQARLKYNTPNVKAGFGRVDAFGQIFNQVGVALNNPVDKLPPPDAPAAYPFLWDIPKHARVQWNGSAPNLGVQRSGSMLRNIGEVIGVFGEIQIDPSKEGLLAPNYSNSANADNLMLLEEWLTALASPKWPGAVDSALAAKGKPLYNQHCVNCHAVVDPSNTPVPTPVTMTQVTDVGTDPVHALNFRQRRMQANALTGHRSFAEPRRPWAKFDAEPFARDLTVNAAVGAKASHKAPFLGVAVDAVRAIWESSPTDVELNVYKARPLNGVWATAPFLHNGSVLTLWELMLPEKSRKATFCIGSAEFDSKNLGYKDDCTGRHSEFDTTKPGNHNTGHLYGTSLDEADKWALLEYLKTL